MNIQFCWICAYATTSTSLLPSWHYSNLGVSSCLVDEHMCMMFSCSYVNGIKWQGKCWTRKQTLLKCTGQVNLQYIGESFLVGFWCLIQSYRYCEKNSVQLHVLKMIPGFLWCSCPLLSCYTWKCTISIPSPVASSSLKFVTLTMVITAIYLKRSNLANSLFQTWLNCH